VISLETDWLVIRNFCPDDWQDLQDVSIHYRASEYAQYDHKWPTATEEVKGMAEWFAEANLLSCAMLKALGFSETGRSTAAFLETPEGAPIVFTALSFSLTRDTWQGKGEAT
jgi:hypothetical protein